LGDAAHAHAPDADEMDAAHERLHQILPAALHFFAPAVVGAAGRSSHLRPSEAALLFGAISSARRSAATAPVSSPIITDETPRPRSTGCVNVRFMPSRASVSAGASRIVLRRSSMILLICSSRGAASPGLSA